MKRPHLYGGPARLIEERSIQVIAALVTSLCLLVRSLMPNLGLARAIMVWYSSAVIVIMSLYLYAFGIPDSKSILLFMIAYFAAGCAGIVVGFRWGKRYREKAVAIALAGLFGPLAWFYVWRDNWLKLFGTITISLANYPLRILFLPLYIKVIFSMAPVGFYVWTIIDMARRPPSYFQMYDSS